MTSSPPGARDTRGSALPRLAEASFRAALEHDPVIFFCVEGAPREACRTRTEGCLTFETMLSGTVVDVQANGELHLDVSGRQVIVRHLLPTAIDLRELAGHDLEVRVVQRYLGPGRATIDAEIRDSCGQLLLWAHDGRMPVDRVSHGLALRVSVEGDGAHRLAIAHSGGVASVRPPDFALVSVGAEAFALAVVRVGADDVSFVLLRR